MRENLVITWSCVRLFPYYYHYTDADNRERAKAKDKTKTDKKKTKETKLIAEEKHMKNSKLR